MQIGATSLLQQIEVCFLGQDNKALVQLPERLLDSQKKSTEIEEIEDYAECKIYFRPLEIKKKHQSIRKKFISKFLSYSIVF